LPVHNLFRWCHPGREGSCGKRAARDTGRVEDGLLVGGTLLNLLLNESAEALRYDASDRLPCTRYVPSPVPLLQKMSGK
jgi:hypothetical protein